MNLEHVLLKQGLRLDKREMLEKRVVQLNKVGNDVFVYANGIKLIVSGQLVATRQRLAQRGDVKIYGPPECKAKLVEIYKECVDLESLVSEVGSALLIKIRIIEANGFVIGYAISAINALLVEMKIPTRNLPTAFTFTVAENSIVADPSKQETNSSIVVVLINDLVVLVETTIDECDFKDIANCVKYSIKNNSAVKIKQ